MNSILNQKWLATSGFEMCLCALFLSDPSTDGCLQTQCGVNFFILDSRRVLAPAPKALEPKHISNPDFAPKHLSNPYSVTKTPHFNLIFMYFFSRRRSGRRTAPRLQEQSKHREYLTHYHIATRVSNQRQQIFYLRRAFAIGSQHPQVLGAKHVSNPGQKKCLTTFYL